MVAQSEFWFRPKRYGYGAEPKNWQGWLATALFVLVVLSLAWLCLIAPVMAGGEPSTGMTAAFWASVVAMTAAFVWLCHRKTDGPWRWRWGGSDQPYDSNS